MARRAPKREQSPRKRRGKVSYAQILNKSSEWNSEDGPAIEVEALHPANTQHAQETPLSDGDGSEKTPDAAGDNLSESSEPAASETEAESERERGGALVPTDPLSRYLAEIRRFPLLTREEESEIAKRYHRDQDPNDAYRLVTANLRLVVKIALEFARASRNVLDLIQEGNVGLMEAVKNFDPYRGIRFPSYAVWWVRAYIYRYLINNWRLVKIGTT